MSESTTIGRLVVAGATADSGTTTVSLGLIHALRGRGKRVQAFKVGSDFLDSAYLAHASGSPCRILDSWVIGPHGVVSAFVRGSADADIAVIDGMAGLFDGHGVRTEPLDGRRFPGSTADIATLIDAPVIVVLDISTMGETAAAVALGLHQFDPRLNIVGVILNNCDNAHRRVAIEDAIWQMATLPVLGTLSRSDTSRILATDHRLVPLAQNPSVDLALEELGRIIGRDCNLDLMERLAAKTTPVHASAPTPAKVAERTVRIGVAFDEAFCFYYPENIELLESCGAEIVPLSPLRDHSIPRDLDAVYIGGALLEDYIDELAANRPFIDSLRRLQARGTPIYAECGGALYMARSVVTRQGEVYKLCGLVAADLVVGEKSGRGRYREITLRRDTVLAAAGTTLRGNEFSAVETLGEKQPGEAAYVVHDGDGEPLGTDGWVLPNLLASPVHLQFAQQPQLAEHFVAAAAAASRQRHSTLAAG